MNYTIFMVLAFGCAWGASRLVPVRLALQPSQRWFIGLVGFSGAVFAAKLPFMVLNDELLHNAGTFLLSGKSILFGLVGGYAGVEIAKRYLGITTKTGDSFVVPVAVGIGVGRLGCFFEGCCYGTVTELPWGIVFPSVDSLLRHPTQLYECGFHLAMAVLFFIALRWEIGKGQLIKLYFLAYFAFRFLTEFIRPEIDWGWGLSGYQWAIVVLAPVFIWLWWRDEVRRDLIFDTRGSS